MIWTYASTHQIFPDSQWYLIYTYHYMGYDKAHGEQIVLDYIRDHGTFKPYEYLWASKPFTLSYRPRVLLPLLSIPWVALFGPGGIVVVPAIAFVVAMFLIYRFATIHASVPASVAAGVLAVTSPLIAKWCVGGLTDSLALMLHTAALLLLPWRKPATKWTVAGLALVTFLVGTARVITPYTVATVAAVWLWAMWRDRDRWRSWTAAAAGAAAGVVAGAIWSKQVSAPLSSRDHFFSMTGGQARTLGEAMPWYRETVPTALSREATVVLSSWPLVLLLVLSIVASVVAWRTVVPWLVASAWIGATGIFLIAPFMTMFRYELPMLPALVVAVAVLLDRVAKGLLPAFQRPTPEQPAPSPSATG
ncbi:hypothetical protein Psuf_087440 [Phytohabitans suffuscus]|uniref:Glycosyltransferase RgtA/B/C/D-like domain-containing protein n=1 Tax=Phytohabitans suffuscus TaxID=624315 RepID=A0A6F8Z030_9ACTN|nr:hypothetical protein [Phytohabitans suffuscus]BCB91431.1 hypothetical protein Psuf_087440 [Phytohabitans suffuscus]